MLETIEKPKNNPPIITITGDAGLGKTTLAAMFPNPIFIRVEDGMQAIPEQSRPDAFPLLQNVDQLWEQMISLGKEEHQYKTLVIDSVTKLETSFIQYVIDNDEKKPKSINTALGGYGAGFNAVASMHARVRKLAGALRDRRGMSVIFIAHAETETIELPDQDAYTRYNLRMNKKSLAHYVDDVDLVGFLKLQTFTTGDGERKKALSDGTRILVTYTTAANISKNRYGISEDLEVPKGINPLIDYIPYLQQTK